MPPHDASMQLLPGECDDSVAVVAVEGRTATEAVSPDAAELQIITWLDIGGQLDASRQDVRRIAGGTVQLE